jgi:gamma-glutamyltranspeptidase/glutathione hydrolase
MRDLHLPGRSVAYGTHGAAATSQQFSTYIALEVLRNGGNAIDAALTASALQCVIEPHNTGIGGDCFALVWSAKDKRLHAYNGSGYAPQGLSDDLLVKQGLDVIAPDSIHAVTIPGAIDCWDRLLKAHGTIGWRDIFAPAIEAAEKGFILHERAAADWKEEEEKLRLDAGARAQLLRDGFAPRTGDLVRFPELAATLKRIANEGRDAFYKGDIAQSLTSFLQAQGGTHALADFHEYQGQTVDAISSRYRDATLYQIPPSGQGLTTMVMLNILDRFDTKDLDPLGVDRFHLQIEASKLAYAMRDTFVADPAFENVPVNEILSARFTDELCARIDSKKAMAPPSEVPAPYQRDTIYLTVADKDGNLCSFINSLYWSFGTGKVEPKTGIALQNRGSCFRIKPGHPNSVKPRKRPLHTIIPSFVTRNDKPWLAYGVMGGAYQPVGQAHVLQNLLDFGCNIQEAFDMPRGFFRVDSFEAERGIPARTLTDLAARGHTIVTPGMPLGGGQGVLVIQHGYAAGTDPRKDGAALAY